MRRGACRVARRVIYSPARQRGRAAAGARVGGRQAGLVLAVVAAGWGGAGAARGGERGGTHAICGGENRPLAVRARQWHGALARPAPLLDKSSSTRPARARARTRAPRPHRAPRAARLVAPRARAESHRVEALKNAARTALGPTSPAPHLHCTPAPASPSSRVPTRLLPRSPLPPHALRFLQPTTPAGAMGLVMKINIVSAAGVGGLYPFVVVCFDGDISNELYKTEATTGGKSAVWNHEHQLDLTANVKALVAAGKPEPTYLTFFVFDTGAPGVPALGSAGVLLETVRDKDKAQGDFPIVNGSGSLRIIVTADKTGHGPSNWSTKKKIAGGVGVAAVGAGLTALAVNHHKKKKKKEAASRADGDESDSDDDGSADHAEGERKKRPWWKGGGKSSSDSDDDRKAEEDAPAEGYPQATKRAVPAPAPATREAEEDDGRVYDDGDYGEAAEEEEEGK